MLRRTLAVVLLAAASATFAAKPAPQESWLLTHVTVIPLDTDEVLQDQDVLIRKGRIASITPAAEKQRVRGATLIDGRGKFLVPGFVDAHVHIATEGAIRDSKDARIAALPLADDHAYDRQVLLSFLKAGVTGAANLGGTRRSDEDLLWLRAEIAAGRIAGPRLYVGKRINGPRAEVSAGGGEVPPSRPEAPRTAADGIAAVRAAQQRGYDFIKPYQFLNRETYQAVVEEARRLHLPTTGHLPELGCAHCADRAFAFDHALDNIAHAEELARYGRSNDFAPRDIDALADLVAARRMGVTPTLITLKTIVHMYTQREVPAVPPGWLALVDPVTKLDWAPPANRYLSEAFRAQEGADTFSIGYDFARLLTRQLWRRGVPLTVGTDAALPGLAFGVSVPQEMFELREIGLSPREVLRAASLNAHRLYAPGSGEGPVRPGRRADPVLLEADPLADIRNVSRVAGVFVHGRWLSVAQIEALLAALAPHTALLQKELQAGG